jgi:hypothetical protein
MLSSIVSWFSSSSQTPQDQQSVSPLDIEFKAEEGDWEHVVKKVLTDATILSPSGENPVRTESPEVVVSVSLASAPTLEDKSSVQSSLTSTIVPTESSTSFSPNAPSNDAEKTNDTEVESSVPVSVDVIPGIDKVPPELKKASASSTSMWAPEPMYQESIPVNKKDPHERRESTATLLTVLRPKKLSSEQKKKPETHVAWKQLQKSHQRERETLRSALFSNTDEEPISAAVWATMCPSREQTRSSVRKAR